MTHARRAAFLVTPHAGGIFSVYVNLRTALAAHGITVEWVGASKDPEGLAADARMAPFLSQGHLVDARNLSDAQLGSALVERISRASFNFAFINVLTSRPEMTVAAYLPAEITRIMIVHNITPGTYSAARAVAPYVHAAVSVSPRIQEDMIQKLGNDPARTFSIPNATDAAPFDAHQRIAFSRPLRLFFLARIVDVDKGVFWLPRIMEKLAGVDCTLTIAGEGPDLPALRAKCAPLGNRIEFLGRVGATEVPRLMASHHVFVMTSRFEGLPNTLIEAMAGGCVPVASHIRGVTDYVVRDDQTGCLFPTGDCSQAAAAIRRIAGDEALHQRLSLAARADVRERFSIATLGRAYASMLQGVAGMSPPRTLCGQPFELLHVGGSWRKLVPNSVKNVLRKHMYK